MNKIFKVIWNHATQSWVAVSEFTKAHGKTKSVSLSKVAVGVAAAVGLVEMSAAAVSSDLTVITNTTTGSMYIGASQPPQSRVDDNVGSIAIGNSTVMRQTSIKIGNNISDQSTGGHGDVIIGHNIRAGGGFNDSLSVAIGNNAQVAGPSVAIGTGARADIKNPNGASAVKDGGVAIGAYSFIGGNIDGGTAVGTMASAAATHAVAIGANAGVYKGMERYNTAFSLGMTWNENGGERGVSIGDESAARGIASVAIGCATTTGAYISNGPRQNSNHAISIGNWSSGLNQNSIAIGNSTQAGIYNAEVVSAIEKKLAEAQEQLANLTARQAELGSFGNGADTATAMEVALNEANLAKVKTIIARYQEDLKKIKNDAADNGWNTIAIGNSSKALNQNAIAIGNSNNVTGNTSIAVGDSNFVSGNFSGAFGDPNHITGDGSYAVGNNNTVNSNDTFVLGSSVGKNARNANLSGTTIANSVYLGKDSEAASGTLADAYTSTSGISQLTADRAGGNTQTAGLGTYTGSQLVTPHVSQYETSGYKLASTTEEFVYAKKDGDPASEQRAGYAGQTPVGVVTVGASDGGERRIVNVAAGLVSEKSTDAINGSQLYAVAIQASRAITFFGNSNKDTGADGTEQILGTSLRVIGATADSGAARDASGDMAEGDFKARNVSTVISNGEIQIQVADQPTFADVTLETEIVPTPNPTSNTAPTANLNKAVSLSDVLNTGFNLQENGTAKDFVQPYDTLNFIDGSGTTVNVTTTDNKVSDIKYDVNVDNDTITINEDGQLVAKQPETGLISVAGSSAVFGGRMSYDGTYVPEGQLFVDGIVGSEDDPAKLVNVTTVIDAVNNSHWNLFVANDDEPSADFDSNSVADHKVNPGNNVTFRGVGAVKVTAEDKAVSASGETDNERYYTVNISVETANVTAQTDGTVGNLTDNPNALVTANDVINAINGSGWWTDSPNATGNTTENTDGADTLVKPGDHVNFEAGNNLQMKKVVETADGEPTTVTYTYETVMNPTFSNVTTGGDVTVNEDGTVTVENPIYMGKDPESGKNVITGLDPVLEDQGTAGTKPADINTSQAATLGDVLNAGWNLQVEGAPVDYVTPYNTVNFVGENGITVTADPASDGELSTVKISVDASGSVVEQAESDAEDKPTTDGSVAPKGSPTALMNAQAVADAINASGFTLKNSAKGGEAPNSDVSDLVNPGDVVEMIAGTNLKVEQEGSNITYSTVMNPTFSNITTGGDVTIDENGNPVVTNPIYMGKDDAGKNVITGLDVTLPENTTAGTKPADINSSQAATLGDVLNAGWNLQVEGAPVDFVTPYNTVNFVGVDGVTVTANPASDGELSTIEIGIAKGGSVVDETTVDEPAADATDGKVTPAGEPDALMTAQAVADAINASGFTLKHSATEGEDLGGDAELINPGDVIEMIAGKNLSVKQEADGKITYATKENVSFTEIKVGAPDENGDVTNPITIADNKITGLDTTLPDPTGETSGTKPDNIDSTQAATLGDVLNAGWNLQVEGAPVDLVTPYNTVNFVGENGITVSADPASDGELSTVKISIDAAGSVLEQSEAPVAEGEEPATQTGKVVPVGNPNALMNAQAVADAINASGFTLKHSATDGEDLGGDAELINPGDVIEMIAGKNLSVQQEADGKITYATKENVSFTEIKVGAPNEDGSENANPITIADNKITGLNTTLPSDVNEDGFPVTNATKPADIDSSQAATLGDVLNAGWNLQADGQPVDLVTPYNIVNFIAGNGVTITPETDGETSSLTFAIDPSSLDMPSTIVEGSDTINVTPTTNENGDTVYTVAANTSPVVANENGSVDTPANPNALATAGDVANAINNSGWKATSGATGTGTVSGTTTELVKPSEEVKFIAGDNMVLAQNGQEFTYSVNPNPTFQTVTAEEGVTVGVPGSGTEVNMTPVAPVNVLDQDGNVAGNSTAPAVNMNGATFTGLAPNLPVTTSVQEGNIAPTTAMTPDLSNVNTSNAATLGDVLNAGWNLQANGDAVDFVKPYDTVNFAAGNGISVTPSTDGTTSTLTIAAETSPLTMNGATADNVGGNGTVATPANPNALATAGDVANAINNSGFDLDIGAEAGTNGTVTANDTAAARVNPGKKVTVNAGRNIEIKRSGSDITVATSNDPVFNSVTANQVNIGPVTMTGSTGADGKAELSVGGARITNVAPGVNPTDAVNVSQLRGEIGNVHNRINKANKDLRAGIAGANAAVGLPQVYIPGKSMVAAAAGTYKGQSAIAVGYSRASDNGKLILKLQGNANTRGDVGGSIGVGYQW